VKSQGAAVSRGRYESLGGVNIRRLSSRNLDSNLSFLSVVQEPL